MNRFFKLVNFELNRFFKFYLILIGITVALQIIGVIRMPRKYLKMSDEHIYGELMSKKEFIDMYGTFSFSEFYSSSWFLGSIALCVVSLMIYVFFIWYRDWFGKNTFIYRLLMLPTPRINIYLAKGTVILLLVLGLVALQLLLIPLETQIIKWILPAEFRTDMSLQDITQLEYLKILYPESFIQFILSYGLGITLVFVVFTSILFERSFRLKGIVFGILYAGLSLLILVAPILINELFLMDYLYPIELFFIELAAGFLVLAGAIWTGNYLINRKIHV